MQSASLQDAMFDALNVPSVTALLAQGLAWPPIYADVPQDDDGQDETPFPYMTFGTTTANPWNTKGALGENSIVQVDVWTREFDFLQCKAIADAVRAALDRVTLGIDGWITTEFQSAAFMRDPDGKTKHGILLFRVLALPDAM